MFEREPERFPLIYIETRTGRFLIGPCAAKVITGLVAMALVVGALILFGPDVSAEVAAILRVFVL